MSFLDEFFSGDKRFQVEELSKYSLHHDKFDTEEYEHLLAEMREFEAAQDRLTANVKTGAHAFGDTFFSTLKANPRLNPKNIVRPSFQVNRRVMDEAMQMKEWDQLRTFSVGDPVAAGLASIAMEPDLQILFDKLDQERKQAEQLEQMMLQWSMMQGEAASLEEAIADPDSPPTDENGEPVNYQEMYDQIAAGMEDLRAKIEAAAGDLETNLDEKAPQMRADIRNALKDAIEESEVMDGMAQMWGLEPGQLTRVPPETRIELAKRMRSDRLRKIAKLFGAMKRMAFAERSKRTIHSRDEIYDIETGSDLARILPMELLALEDPTLEWDFYRRFYEGQLMQYKLRGDEKLARGGIIWCEDGSGSMMGERQVWAKATGLVLLQIARSQKRPFLVILFGSPGKLKIWDFRDTSKISIEQVLDYASCEWNSGTCFVTPLSKALDYCQEELDRTGGIKSDIVFATDGMCGVPREWLDKFHEEVERLKIKVYGIIYGGSPQSEPLNEICSGKVVSISTLASGEQMREVYRVL